MLTLDKIKRGQKVKILSIPNHQVRSQAIRFGIAEGSVVEIQEVVPAGPVVLKKNKQEIALGRRLAKEIAVELVSTNLNTNFRSKTLNV